MNSRTTTVVLALSIGINLLVAGAVIGHLLRGGPAPRFPALLSEVVHEVVDEVAPDQRALRQELKSLRQKNRQLHRGLRRQQRKLMQDIMAEPFDESATRQAFADLRTSSAAVQSSMHEQMITIMKNLTPEERARVMKRILNNRSRKPPTGEPPRGG